MSSVACLDAVTAFFFRLTRPAGESAAYHGGVGMELAAVDARGGASAGLRCLLQHLQEQMARNEEAHEYAELRLQKWHLSVSVA